MLSFLFAHNDRAQDRPDSKVRPKFFSGLPSEDVLAWLDHFEMISSYHRWSDERKALEVRTLLKNVTATWYVQQSSDVTENWVILRNLLVQNITHQNSAQTALQQLETLQQQAHEPVGQFGVRFIPNLALVTFPLRQLLKKGVSFNWDPACEDSFHHLKTMVQESGLLAHPTFDQLFTL